MSSECMFGKHGQGGTRIKMKGIFLQVVPHLYDLPNSTVGLDAIAAETVSAVPALVPLIMLFVWFTVFLGGISRQKLGGRSADYAMWSVVASLSTYMIALILTLADGLIRLDWLVIITVVTIFSGLWLFLDRRAGEI